MSDKPMSGSVQPRVFLVVVDESEEYRVAVHYAARRAAHTGGRLALLYVIEPAEMQQWMAIEELARAERRETAEELLKSLCEEISPESLAVSIVFIREGRRLDAMVTLSCWGLGMSILVVGGVSNAEGPGLLICFL